MRTDSITPWKSCGVHCWKVRLWVLPRAICRASSITPILPSRRGLGSAAASAQALLPLGSLHGRDEILHNLARACAGGTWAFIVHDRHPHTVQPLAVMMAALPQARADRTEGVTCLAFARAATEAGGDEFAVLMRRRPIRWYSRVSVPSPAGAVRCAVQGIRRIAPAFRQHRRLPQSHRP